MFFQEKKFAVFYEDIFALLECMSKGTKKAKISNFNKDLIYLLKFTGIFISKEKSRR